MGDNGRNRRGTRREWLTLCGSVTAGTAVLAGCADEDEHAADEADGATDGTSRSSGDWPMFGADRQNTGYQPHANGPTDDVSVRWRLEGGDQFNSSPAVIDGTVYAACWDENLYAVNSLTGEIEWEEEVGLVSSPPCVSKNIIYVSTSDGELCGFNTKNGEHMWEEELNYTIKHPVPVDETIYILASGRLISSARHSDESTILLEDLGGVPEAPAIRGSNLFTGDRESALIYNIKSDEIEYRFENESGERMYDHSPTVVDDSIYISGSDSAVYAFDILNKQIKWKYVVDGRTPTAPSVANGSVYFGSWNNYLYSVDTESGKMNWKFDAKTILSEKPTVTDTTVYITAEDTLYAVDVDSGQEQWSFVTTGESTITDSPVVAEDVVYISSRNNTLYALEGA
ncbi:outer membrane protein assembly factor BamB family protein [Natrarchaeobius oligotrophus]|uniref:Pyrrolo-quinoline quinone repeat domain-containing protein n=1 Tax=Natrarchaeobius chitinivorans TaxID=1679083 RepID=A0A3N6N196_NATCH|nr:PQQ-binding-like beta-propeller repeat protein [Natrarchaeobius chitinivorans]RQH01287.1 hypothetical protein EA472_07490 [Natrarchaeobius chitinivorans]